LKASYKKVPIGAGEIGFVNALLTSKRLGNFFWKKKVLILNWTFLHDIEFPLRKVNSGSDIISLKC
jgi:hypothetical protein